MGGWRRCSKRIIPFLHVALNLFRMNSNLDMMDGTVTPEDVQAVRLIQHLAINLLLGPICKYDRQTFPDSWGEDDRRLANGVRQAAGLQHDVLPLPPNIQIFVFIRFFSGCAV
jgi:hypothetical protein